MKNENVDDLKRIGKQSFYQSLKFPNQSNKLWKIDKIMSLWLEEELTRKLVSCWMMEEGVCP